MARLSQSALSCIQSARGTHILLEPEHLNNQPLTFSNQPDINRQMTRLSSESLNAESSAKTLHFTRFFFLQFPLHDGAYTSTSCSGLLDDRSQPRHPTLAATMRLRQHAIISLTPRLSHETRTSAKHACPSERNRAMGRPSCAQFHYLQSATHEPGSPSM